MLLSVLLVTEPMPFSLHDQELAVGASRFSGLPPEEKRI